MDLIYRSYENAKINFIIDSAIKGIDPSWPTIYKIRYIYLEIGKFLYKDVDFFFSVDKKLGEANLSVDEIKDIYNRDKGRLVNKYLRVICKSAACILKEAYDRVGIKSELVETNTTFAVVDDEEHFDINHWFLAIHNDELDQIYFATLTPDLPYIQMNMSTRHFGSDIQYTREINGQELQVYKGDKINNTVISRDKLREIDIAIGYIKTSYQYNSKGQLCNDYSVNYDEAGLYMLRDSLKDNRLFYDLEIQESSFYGSMLNFYKSDNELFSFIEDDATSLNSNDWNIWTNLLCQNVLRKIEKILGYQIYALPSFNNSSWNYDSWLLRLCVLINDDICRQLGGDNYLDFPKIDVCNFSYRKWSKEVKKYFNVKISEFDYDNILLILDKMNTLVNWVRLDYKSGSFTNLFLSLAYHFINSSHLYDKNISDNGYLSNYYVANKFNKLFKRIFNCNNGATSFNKMGYSEKVVIIKEVLSLMFPEINRANSCDMANYNDDYSAVLNRIHIYPVRDKISGYYSIVFNISGYFFFYNTKTNEFEISDALDMYDNYIIVSNRMKKSIEDLEKVDGKIVKKNKKK